MDTPLDGDPTSVAIRDGFRKVYATVAYDLVLPRIYKRLTDAVVASGNTDITDSLLTGSEWGDLVDDQLVDDLGDSSLDGLLAAGLAIGLLSRRSGDVLVDVVTESVDSMYTFGDFLREQIESWWENGRAAGWDAGQFTEQVESFTSPVSQARADLGARVNETAASNAGVHAGMMELYHPGGEITDDDPAAKVAALTWITMRDDRVREAHVAVDADTVPVGQPFVMSDSTGVYEARFPGDPLLPIGLRINCRCRLGYVEGALVRRAVYGTRQELLDQAKTLDIRGRHSMTKPELQMAVMKKLCLQGLATGPDCPDMLDQMNRPALLTLARSEGIRGRYAMNRDQLVEALSGRLTPTSPLRTALGYAAPGDVQAARRKATAMRRRTAPATGDGQLPRPDARNAARGAVFAEFGGPTRGYVPCVHCGLRLGATRDAGLAVLVPEPIIAWSDGGTLSPRNLLPACAGCFQAGGGRGLVSSAFALDEPYVFVGQTVRALALGSNATPQGERTLSIDDAPLDVVQLGVLHSLYVDDLDYPAYTVNGIPVDPASVHPVTQYGNQDIGLVTFESLGLEQFQSGMPSSLKAYWLGEEGSAKIGWGEKGSFARCVSYLRDHVGDAAEGTCANLYHEATGRWPGAHKTETAAATDEFRWNPFQPRDPKGVPTGGRWSSPSAGGPILNRADDGGWVAAPLDTPPDRPVNTGFRGPATTTRQRYEAGQMEDWEKDRYEAQLRRVEERNTRRADRSKTPSVVPSREDRESVSGDLFGRNGDLFGDNQTAPAPFREAAPADVDRAKIDAAVAHPQLARLDPRVLHVESGSTIDRDAVAYYAGREYDRTGMPFTDDADTINRLPVVWRNDDGTHILLSGKARAAASLIAGETFDAVIVSNATNPPRRVVGGNLGETAPRPSRLDPRGLPDDDV